ncbi:MAG: T9SS type A sorting domain-containing protein, partial [candidate division Zixibacteria bacterium]|nr:T9SS type A sorting domain-containing protein [candidate division Zixibacteria bacterium]
GDGVITGLFNGDDVYDLAVIVRFNENLETNGCVYLYWGGPGFDTLPDLIIPHPGEYQSGYQNFGRVLESLGDLNGDGYDDFIAGTGVAYDDTANFVFFGGPGLDSIPDLTIREKLTVARLAGDVNNDSYDDLITSYPLPMSGPGNVNIYFGGPDMDDAPDLSIRNGDMTEYQTLFGMDCSGVGDVNGDGIDDFAFSAIDVYFHGVVYVWAGWDGGTDVEFDYEPTIPVDFSLSQNYPNPFNPSTTIEFSLPGRCAVSLTIHNILGEKVRTLINKELAAGAYTLEWDGRNDDGTPAATGIYLYRIQTDSGSISRKMLLLK